MFVYLTYGNDSPNWVYFDDFNVTHTKSNVIQYNEYYPFGLQTENSWTRSDHQNKFLYNAGSELNESGGWYETFFRGYDAALGRFQQVDPMASALASYSPYNFGLNNPVYFNDPMGDYVEPTFPPEAVGPSLADLFGEGGGPAGFDQIVAETFGGEVIPGYMGEIQGYLGTTIINVGNIEIEIDWRKVENGATITFDDGVATGISKVYEENGQYGATIDVYKEWWQDGTVYLGTEYIRSYFKPLIAQQEWTPQFVNENFGDEFQWKYRLHPSTSFPSAGDAAFIIRRMKARFSGFTGVEHYLIPEESSPTFALRPVSFEIRYGNEIIKTPIVDPADLNSSRIWGNPGTISPEGVPTPINYNLEDGSVISVTIFFQHPLGP